MNPSFRSARMIFLSLASFVPVAVHSEEPGKETRPPNVVVFLADDLGYADLACTGHPCARTPALDRLASEGARFTQHYVTGVVCCPSRTGLMTGRFPARFARYPAGHGFGDRITVTELLKARGYRTGHFGKWHIGPDPMPGTYGIDEIVVKGKSRNAPVRDDDLVTEAIRFIEKNAEGPFYVDIWGHSTHYPVQNYPELAKELGDIHFDRGDFAETIQRKLGRSSRCRRCSRWFGR